MPAANPKSLPNFAPALAKAAKTAEVIATHLRTAQTELKRGVEAFQKRKKARRDEWTKDDDDASNHMECALDEVTEALDLKL